MPIYSGTLPEKTEASCVPTKEVTGAAAEGITTRRISPLLDETGLSGFEKVIIYLDTIIKLGSANVARVAIHRVCKKAGIYKIFVPPVTLANLKFSTIWASSTNWVSAPWSDRSVISEANKLLLGSVTYFSADPRSVGSPPNWFLTAMNTPHPQSVQHWSDIADFTANVGDIKVVWEPSRFSWATVFARAWRVTGDRQYLSALQQWILDWCHKNPPYSGPNWMCGQEASIRLLNFLLALKIAGVENGADVGLAGFVEMHCRRIDLTSFYAVAQDNNHATTEAVALFVGGTCLSQSLDREAKDRGERWARKGRKLLERAVNRLILPDGSFSQYSLTYHRMMLDTLSLAEAWRRQTDGALFTDTFYQRAAAATHWLRTMIDPITGDGPNFGSNDGTHPFRLDATPYRDFRSSLQLASMLFNGCSALSSTEWDEPAGWLNVPIRTGSEAEELNSQVFRDGGYVVMRNANEARVIVRTPTARFRPPHADALHIDFWWRGKNLLRDGGTYTYADDVIGNHLAAAIGHNVPQFDGRDQMPRLGRFLYGKWTKTKELRGFTASPDAQLWTGEFIDHWGVKHERTITLSKTTLRVDDKVEGFKRNALLRWRLCPAAWLQNGTECISGDASILIDCNVPIRRFQLTFGWESRYYLQKSEVPVLEVEIEQSPALFTTLMKFS